MILKTIVDIVRSFIAGYKTPNGDGEWHHPEFKVSPDYKSDHDIQVTGVAIDPDGNRVVAYYNLGCDGVITMVGYNTGYGFEDNSDV